MNIDTVSDIVFLVENLFSVFSYKKSRIYLPLINFGFAFIQCWPNTQETEELTPEELQQKIFREKAKQKAKEDREMRETQV